MHIIYKYMYVTQIFLCIFVHVTLRNFTCTCIIIIIWSIAYLKIDCTNPSNPSLINIERSTDLFSVVNIFSKEITKREVEQEQILLCDSATQNNTHPINTVYMYRS